MRKNKNHMFWRDSPELKSKLFHCSRWESFLINSFCSNKKMPFQWTVSRSIWLLTIAIRSIQRTNLWGSLLLQFVKTISTWPLWRRCARVWSLSLTALKSSLSFSKRLPAFSNLSILRALAGLSVSSWWALPEVLRPNRRNKCAKSTTWFTFKSCKSSKTSSASKATRRKPRDWPCAFKITNLVSLICFL